MCSDHETNGPYPSAGVCAAVKTSKIPITVNAKSDITCKFMQRGCSYMSER